MKKFKLLALTFLFFIPVAKTNAEINEYNVEIVIFEDASSRHINSELWPVIHHEERSLSNDTGNSEVVTPTINSVLNITQNTGTILAEHVAKIERSSRYNVLLYKSWQQAGLDDENAIEIKIDSVKTVSTDDKTIIPVQTNSTLTTGTDIVKESNITGTIKLILGRYLHIHTDLLYKRLNKNYDPASPILHNKLFDEFEIQSQRRMRSKELHYIDHPLLGILVIVTPIERLEPTKGNEKTITQ